LNCSRRVLGYGWSRNSACGVDFAYPYANHLNPSGIYASISLEIKKKNNKSYR